MFKHQNPPSLTCELQAHNYNIFRRTIKEQLQFEQSHNSTIAQQDLNSSHSRSFSPFLKNNQNSLIKIEKVEDALCFRENLPPNYIKNMNQRDSINLAASQGLEKRISTVVEGIPEEEDIPEEGDNISEEGDSMSESGDWGVSEVREGKRARGVFLTNEDSIILSLINQISGESGSETCLPKTPFSSTVDRSHLNARILPNAQQEDIDYKEAKQKVRQSIMFSKKEGSVKIPYFTQKERTNQSQIQLSPLPSALHYLTPKSREQTSPLAKLMQQTHSPMTKLLNETPQSKPIVIKAGPFPIIPETGCPQKKRAATVYQSQIDKSFQNLIEQVDQYIFEIKNYAKQERKYVRYEYRPNQNYPPISINHPKKDSQWPLLRKRMQLNLKKIRKVLNQTVKVIDRRKLKRKSIAAIYEYEWNLAGVKCWKSLEEGDPLFQLYVCQARSTPSDIVLLLPPAEWSSEGISQLVYKVERPNHSGRQQIEEELYKNYFSAEIVRVFKQVIFEKVLKFNRSYGEAIGISQEGGWKSGDVIDVDEVGVKKEQKEIFELLKRQGRWKKYLTP